LTNIDWKEYVYWQKDKFGVESQEYLSALPDTTVWRYGMEETEPQYQYKEPLVETYYNHPAYDSYPVVGISYEQAVAYCVWRTDRVKEMILLNASPENKALIKNLKYRLPTKTEWELIAKSGKDVEKMEKYKKKKKYRGKPKFYNVQVEAADGYNLFGNVAEMIAEKGIAKGGSFMHSYEETLSMKDIAYTQPRQWLGFRCVCEL